MAESPYARAESDANRQRGAQTPAKYHQVGNNYREFGEQSGYVYNPWLDEYFVDPNAYSQYQEQVGITKPTPGLLETVGPLAATGLALSGGQALGAQIPGMLSGLGGMFGGGGASAAASGAVAPTGLGTAMASSPVSGVGASGGGLFGIGALPAAAIAGGVGLGIKGVKDLFSGKDTKGWEGYGGRATLGIATGGLSELARMGGLFGGPKTEVEDERLQALKDKGVLGQDYQINRESRSRAEQVRDLEASGSTDISQFLRTGDVKDLTAKDIQGYAALLERNPNDLQARLNDATDALAAGAVREGKGSIFVDWDKVNAYRQANPQANKPAQYNFEPNSPEYIALSKEEKDKYWSARNG